MGRHSTSFVTRHAQLLHQVKVCKAVRVCGEAADGFMDVNRVDVRPALVKSLRESERVNRDRCHSYAFG